MSWSNYTMEYYGNQEAEAISKGSELLCTKKFMFLHFLVRMNQNKQKAIFLVQVS